MNSIRLWEVEHAYYCSEGNFFNNDCTREFRTWTEFLREYGNADFDYNLLFRWDWEPHDGESDTGEKRRSCADQFGMRDQAWTLKLFWMGQRKGLFQSTLIEVCKDDEPAVREFLVLRAEHMRKLWTPLLGTED